MRQNALLWVAVIAKQVRIELEILLGKPLSEVFDASAGKVTEIYACQLSNSSGFGILLTLRRIAKTRLFLADGSESIKRLETHW